MTKIISAKPTQSADRGRWDVIFVLDEPPDDSWCDEFTAQVVYFEGDDNGSVDFITTSTDTPNYHPSFTSHNTFRWPHVLKRDVPYIVKAVKRARDSVDALHDKQATEPVTGAAVAQVVMVGFERDELQTLLDELLLDEQGDGA